MKWLWMKLYNAKSFYSLANTVWLILFAPKECVSKRNQYYDCKEGLIYRWQMHIINIFKNRNDSWTLEEELKMIEENKDAQI